MREGSISLDFPSRSIRTPLRRNGRFGELAGVSGVRRDVGTRTGILAAESSPAASPARRNYRRT